MVRLRVTSGPIAGQMFEVMDEVVIGRQNADVTIDDALISRRHALVRLIPGALEIEDLGSANGTFVDGNRITSPTCVGGGARIRLGTTVLEVEGVAPARATRLNPLADPQATRQKSIPADLTRARPAQRADLTRAHPARQPDVTRPRPMQPAELTRARQVQPAPGPAPIEPATPRPDPSQPAHADVPQATRGASSTPASVGEFRPPSRPGGRGLASRSWLPVVLSYGTVVLVAVALVIYFASR